MQVCEGGMQESYWGKVGVASSSLKQTSPSISPWRIKFLNNFGSYVHMHNYVQLHWMQGQATFKGALYSRLHTAK